MKFRFVKETINGSVHYFSERKCGDSWQFVSHSLAIDATQARAIFNELIATGTISNREVLAVGEYKIEGQKI